MAEAVAYSKVRSYVLSYFAEKERGSRDKARQVLDELRSAGMTRSSDLTVVTAAKLVKRRGFDANPNTTRGLLSYFMRICSLCVDKGWLKSIPRLRGVAPAARKRTRNPAVPGELVARLLNRLTSESEDWQTHRLLALTSFIALTGVRYREAIGTRRENLDLEAGSVQVRAGFRRLKTSDSTRLVPLPDALVNVLELWLPRVDSWLFPGVRSGAPWDGGSPGYKPLDRLRQRAAEVGIEAEKLTWHGLRRTYATQAVRRWKLPITDVARILGHTSARTTERYIEDPDPRELRELVRGVGYPM